MGKSNFEAKACRCRSATRSLITEQSGPREGQVVGTSSILFIT